MAGSTTTAGSTERRYAGRTGAERRAERHALLVGAAADLVRGQGLAAIGVRPVCRAAGLTERYFYESFSGVDDLLSALFDAQLTSAARLVSAAVAAAERSPEAAVRAAVGAFVDLVAHDPLPGRLLVESVSHPVLAARRRTAVDTFVELIVATGTELVGPPPDARSARRARRLAVALVGGLHELLVQWLADPAELAATELVDDVGDLFLATLGRVGHRG